MDNERIAAAADLLFRQMLTELGLDADVRVSNGNLGTIKVVDRFNLAFGYYLDGITSDENPGQGAPDGSEQQK